MRALRDRLAETEIEVTPAMVKAGERALLGFDLDYESRDDAAARIFLAMWRARIGDHSEPA